MTDFDFTATDACGNRVTKTASYVVARQDRLDENPQDLTVETDGQGNKAQFQTWLSTYGGARLDGAESVAWDYSYTQQLVSACPHTTHVTFTATDDCNNVIHATGSYTVIDTTAPTIVTPAQNTVVESDGHGNSADLYAWISNNGGAKVYDAGGPPTWTHTNVQFRYVVLYNVLVSSRKDSLSYVTFNLLI